MKNQALSINEKQIIREALKNYCAKYPSQTKAAASLKGTSSGTISSILNSKDENISDDMYRNIASQVCKNFKREWSYVETSCFKEITDVFQDAQTYGNITWVVGEAGCGKTTTGRLYAEKYAEVYYILCSEDMKRGEFLREIARTMGLRTDGYRIREILDLIVSELIQGEAPLLIFDEADKLADPVFHYFISLYNRLEESCGIVFLSTSYIKRRIEMGLRYNKKGYNEIHSRIGRKFYMLDETSANDVYAICSANGLTQRKHIDEVLKDAGDYEYDLRRVKRAIHRVKRMANAI